MNDKFYADTQYFKVESSNRAARLSNVQRSSSSSPWELRPIRAKQSGGGDSQSLESGNRLNYSKSMKTLNSDMSSRISLTNHSPLLKDSDKKFKDNINRTSVMRRVSSVSQSLPQDVEIKPFRDRCSAKSSVPVKSNTGRSSNSREEWQIQKQSLLKKFGPSGWMPRKRLSPDALEGIRALHSQFPEKYPTPVLAEQFKVSPEAVRRILKSKWRPNEEEEESRRKRWDRRGKAIWDQMAEIGIKPPKKWRKMGVGKNRKRLVGVNESSQVSELRHAFGNISNDRKIQKDFQTNHGMHHDISLSDRML